MTFLFILASCSEQPAAPEHVAAVEPPTGPADMVHAATVWAQGVGHVHMCGIIHPLNDIPYEGCEVSLNNGCFALLSCIVHNPDATSAWSCESTHVICG